MEPTNTMYPTATNRPGNGSDTGRLAPHAPDTDGLARDFRSFIADVEGVVKQAQHLSGDGALLARQKLEEKVSQAKVKLESARVAAAEHAMRSVEATGTYVRREPMKALGIALAVGAVVGLLLSRR